MWFRRLALAVVLLCGAVRAASGVILLETGDPTANTTTPGDNSGWQYEGQFGVYLGTPISPYFFLTAGHIHNAGNSTFIFHGDTYTAIANDPDPLTDLQLWEVDHSHPFPCFAPVFAPDPQQANIEIGQQLRVFGRGTQRSPDGVYLAGDPTLRGWNWGADDAQERWGTNLVTNVVPAIVNPDGSVDWYFLQANFDSPGLPHEAHLSRGDSGGAMFILQNGIWCVAGINYGVDDLSTSGADGNAFDAAVFDARGFYGRDANNNFVLIPDEGVNVPTAFYCTQISSRLTWIEGVIGGDPTALAPESFSAWQHAYFTPAQISAATVSGPAADPDGDGVSNLLEFAFNLDPTYAEPAVMTAGTGLCGLPLIRLEQIATADTRLTVEFVRRTAASGSGLTYAVQFASSLDPAAPNWQTSGTESVTAINTRWERVKVTDTVSSGSANPARFARVNVTQAGTPQTQARVRPLRLK